MITNCYRAFYLSIALVLFSQLTLQSIYAEDHENRKLKALIVDGQNNHNAWPKTTQMMHDYLEESGRFEVEIYRSRFLWKSKRFGDQFTLDDGKEYSDLKKPKTDDQFSPAFANYDVVISNFGWRAAAWPEATRDAFEKYMAEGGGFVVVHAADNSFPEWAAFNRMIGLGGWGGRNEKSGPYVYYNTDDKLVRDTSKGSGGGHGPQRELPIVVREPDHPIMSGMPNMFMQAKDELYQTLRGPAENMTVLATGFAAKKFGGTGRHEPVVMTIDYEKGRVFHTTLGHDDYSFESVALITLIQRGCEWAATGKVTLPVPDDFPTSEATSSRKYKVKEPVLVK